MLYVKSLQAIHPKCSSIKQSISLYIDMHAFNGGTHIYCSCLQDLKSTQDCSTMEPRTLLPLFKRKPAFQLLRRGILKIPVKCSFLMYAVLHKETGNRWKESSVRLSIWIQTGCSDSYKQKQNWQMLNTCKQSLQKLLHLF